MPVSGTRGNFEGERRGFPAKAAQPVARVHGVKGKGMILWMCLWLSLVAVDLALAAPPQADKITKEELLPLLSRPDVIIIDMRFGRDWTDATLKIKGAVREDPMKPGLWIDKYPKDKMLVFYCA
jgi:hypothetical protein